MKPLSYRTLWGFGAGNLGFGLISQIMAAYLVFYATAILGMSGASVGLLVSIGIIWDAFSDPIMGYLSDHTRSDRFGRRHLYLLIGGIGVTILHVFLWNLSREMEGDVKWFLMVFYVMSIKTFMTIYITPYTALAAEISDDYTDRTRIQAVKTIFFLIGLFLATAFGMAIFFRGTLLYPIGQLNPAGYRNMSIFGSALMLLSMAFAYRSTKHLVPELNARLLSNQAPSFSAFFKEMAMAFANLDFRSVVLGYLFANIASALISTLALHVYTFTFHMNNNGIALIVGIQLMASILSQPFWIRYSDKYEKKKAVHTGILIAIVGSLYFVACVYFKSYVQANVLLLIPFGALAGFGTGGLFTLPQAMVADTVDSNAIVTGKRQEGVFYGTLTLCYKLSQSIAIFMLGIALDYLRFDPRFPVQSEFTAIGLALLLSIGSIISFAFAYMSYLPYSLSRAKMSEIHHQIDLMKASIK
jgi:Na+/melibiose symporter-like transporter